MHEWSPRRSNLPVRIISLLLRIKLFELFVIHLPASSITLLRLLVILQQVSPLVSTHGCGPIIPQFAHSRSNLLPEMLVGFGSIEELIQFSTECNEAMSFIMDPCLGSPSGHFDFDVLSTALSQKYLLEVLTLRMVAVGVVLRNVLDIVGIGVHQHIFIFFHKEAHRTRHGEEFV